MKRFNGKKPHDQNNGYYEVWFKDPIKLWWKCEASYSSLEEARLRKEELLDAEYEVTLIEIYERICVIA